MPAAANTQNKNNNAQKNEALFHFEVGAPKLFKVNFQAHQDNLLLDLGLGEHGTKFNVPVPSLVQYGTKTAYGYVQPYAEWGYDKFLTKKASK